MQRLSDDVAVLKMEKDSIGWDLEVLEISARQALERDPDSDDESEDEIERMLPAPL